ncbi:transposon Tf2-1 polyprotein [Sesbania bispinosa]|nr:transposon Tf2-1 polyprotein [Sesbania bispinosa]
MDAEMGDVVEPIRVLGGGSDRAHEQRGHQGDQLLGQHSQGPRIWRVYSRKRIRTRGNQQVEETVMHSGEVVGAKARIENGRGGENVCVQNY